MSTNLHIDDIGNLILRDGKLDLFVSSQYVTPPHYGGGRVGALSPYAYCAGDPVNCADPDGRIVINAVAGLIGGVIGAGIGAYFAWVNDASEEKIWGAAAGGLLPAPFLTLLSLEL